MEESQTNILSLVGIFNDKETSEKKLDTVNQVPWVDKYRPKKLKHIVQQTEVIKVLKTAVKTGELPHILLYGPPGTGKTSTILAMAMEMYGPKIIEERVIELNASDDRGINIVRDKIITFAKMCLGNSDPDYPSPPYKLVILDEADAMTNEAQSALRQIIETSSSSTRFCFICNYIDKIIEPIASRCIKFRFKPIDKHYLSTRLNTIAMREKISIDKNAINLICDISEGDARRAIMILQYVKYFNKVKKNIMVEDITYITDCVDDKVINEIWDCCGIGEISEILDLAKKIKNSAYSVSNIFEKLKTKMVVCDLEDDKKSKFIFDLSYAETNLLEGANEYLQMLDVLMKLRESL